MSCSRGHVSVEYAYPLSVVVLGKRNNAPAPASPPGNAQRRSVGPHARFPVMADLPSSLRMTDPRYQDIRLCAIPEVTDDDHTHVGVICGEFGGREGRWKDWLLIRIISISQLPRAIGRRLGRDYAESLRLCIRGRGEVPGRLRSPRSRHLPAPDSSPPDPILRRRAPCFATRTPGQA